MSPDSEANLDRIAVVLVEPSHPGNIGAAARAMKNMGLTRLKLVSPTGFPSAEASARASGATDVLARAEVVDGLDAALGDAEWVLGTTARGRELGPPVQEPRQAALDLATQAEAGRTVVLLFGREKRGLSNRELDRCNRVVHIPAAPGYSSLNLAQAVQILSYEVFRALGAERGSPEGPPEAGDRDISNLFAHWERLIRTVGFLNPQSPQRTFRRLRRLLLRAQPSEGEVRFLRGFLSAVEKRIHGVQSRSERGASRADRDEWDEPS